MREKPLLFCFPFAGGTADFYNELENACGENIRFVKLEYSGHGKRMGEPLYRSFSEMTDDLYPQIMRERKKFSDADYALLGYSMGSIAMFDMLQRICADEDGRKPRCVFLSAHQPQPIRELLNIPESGIDSWAKNRTIAAGGIDERLLHNKSFWRLYLPIFRADYQLIAAYNFEEVRFQTKIPAVVFYSEEDTPYRDMHAWTKYFVGSSEFVRFDGQHFFIHRHCREMAEIIQKKLTDEFTQGDYHELR